jgi:hypothetical protein
MSRTVSAPLTNVPFSCDVSSVAEGDKAEAVRMAREWLFALSGGRVGAFTTIEDAYYPVRGETCGLPYKDQRGVWQNGNRSDGQSCCEITLSRQPVRSVQAVRVNGVTLAPSEYIVTGNTLRRLDVCFPTEDDCEAPPVEVDYTWGVSYGSLGLRAVGALACEMLAAVDDDRECNLPSGAQSVVRQGVTVTRPDLQAILDNGLTGIGLVDAFIRTHNPNRLHKRSRVVALDGAIKAV